MHKFIKFLEDLYLNRYELVLQKLINDHTSCGIFMPFYPPEAKRGIIKQLRDNGIRLEVLFSIDQSDFTNPPEEIKIVPPPRV